MADEITINDYSPDVPRFRITEEGDQTIIRDYATGAPRFRINGDIGGGATVMTTEERTAAVIDEGKLVYDSDLDALFAGDGVTSGGVAVGGGTSGVIPGYRMNDSGGTLNQDRFFPIETVSGATVTLQAGHAYVINATSGGITLNCESFASNTFGLEGHATIYTANAGFVQQGANVYLADPLEPDAVNNCTIRFHGGSATIAVEDYFGGYIVLSGGTGSGSLPYGLASAGSTYIGFDASLNGSALNMSGAVTNGEKHVVGNGYTQTILTGGISCTSNTTFANLAMSGVVNSGGTMTLADVFIPAGGTVSVSVGGIMLERVSGGTIDMGGTNIYYKSDTISSVTIVSCTVTNGGNVSNGGFSRLEAGRIVSATSCVFAGNSAAARGGVFFLYNNGTLVATECTFSSNSAATMNYGGAIIIQNGGSAILTSCTFSSNSAGADTPNAISFTGGGYLSLNGCSFESGQTVYIYGSNTSNRIFEITGSNRIDTIGHYINAGIDLTISSGAIVTLTSTIEPGGAVSIPAGAIVTIIGSGGSSSAYLSELALTGSTITNAPAVLGATVTIPASGGPYEVHFADGTSSTYAAGEAERQEVLSGAVVYIGEL